ncbi:MAG: hypothetical protein ACK56I_04350, partial [bacterium]
TTGTRAGPARGRGPLLARWPRGSARGCSGRSAPRAGRRAEAARCPPLLRPWLRPLRAPPLRVPPDPAPPSPSASRCRRAACRRGCSRCCGTPAWPCASAPAATGPPSRCRGPRPSC